MEGLQFNQTAQGSVNHRPFFGRVESLRGLGAMAVAAYHISGWVMHDVGLLPQDPWDGVSSWQNTLRHFGRALIPAHAALMVFFVISGFVLRLSLSYGPQTTWAASGKFVLGRIFRIYPVVVLGLVLTVLKTGGQVFPHDESARVLTVSEFLANMLLLDVSMNTCLWALQVEMLMVPFFLFFYFLERRFGPYLLLGLAIITTVLGYSPRWAVWPPLSINIFAFILGMTIPTLGRSFALSLSKFIASSWAISACFILFLTAPCFGLYSRYSAVVEAYTATALVSLIAYRQDLSVMRFLDPKPLRLLGLASGSYYVLHMTVLLWVLTMVSVLIPPAWSISVPALAGFLGEFLCLVALAPLAICSYYLIEAPGIALGRKVIRWCVLESSRSTGPQKQRLAA